MLIIIIFLMYEMTVTNTAVDVFNSPGTFFQSLNRERRWVTYPSGTAIGLLVAIALPVEVPEENLYFSLNFEANYNLPDNITQYYNSDIARILHKITRRSTYHLIQNQFEREGYDGEECLLRMICETSKHELPINGLIEAIYHIIFQPSKSIEEEGLEKYIKAEQFGFNDGDCDRQYYNCNLSLLDLFSILQ